LSTFSIDVDTASYSNVRRFIQDSQLPPRNAVRIEEMINYFSYDYPQPKGKHPFSIVAELSDCPWNPVNQLLHIGLKGKVYEDDKVPNSNLVFLLDVSGSMKDDNKLPLVKQTMNLLIYQLRHQDRVSIVTYRDQAQQVLESTSGKNKKAILDVIENLHADGSTAGEYGLKLAYKAASKSFMKEGNNRIILATDGDFNVGISDDNELIKLIEKERKRGIFLTILGFGTGNIKDAKLEKIANKGNGHYAYIDSLEEGKKVMLDQLKGTLHTIAKDVKIQVEFNPANVKAYRLIGYENRALPNQDFHDDTKDAGELGEGHTVTALYEIVPVESQEIKDVLRYQKAHKPADQVHKDELMAVKLRYKEPSEDKSKLIALTVSNKPTEFSKTTDNFRFSAAVAEFGLLLRNSNYKAHANIKQVLALALSAKGKDEEGHRAEFTKMVQQAESLLKKLAKNDSDTKKSIDGKVVAATKDKKTGYDKLVMLSVGKQDGVKKGYEFILYRGTTYICTVVVQKVFDDSCVCSVIPESINRDKNGKPMDINQYDRASTEVF
jgi:Ca-activated chloride channel family protein